MVPSSTQKEAPQSDTPTFARYATEDFVQGAGVAIFHIASARVVVCSAVDRRVGKYYFLPKGRRDAGEDTRAGAEREGYEEVRREQACPQPNPHPHPYPAITTQRKLANKRPPAQSGYRNRVLPLPSPHHQPQAHPRLTAPPTTAEPIWIQLMPLARNTKQYLLFWYIAETLPPSAEGALETGPDEPYKTPPAYPAGLTLAERVVQEPAGYEPRHHEGTGVDAEEAAYESRLVGVEEAVGLLGGTDGVMADVVRRGWEGIRLRWRMEEEGGEVPERFESPEQLAEAKRDTTLRSVRGEGS
ncbi:hypothetical protein PMIN01_01353 [Paraphaeosphaeria minitans]|uniref:Nudix hydrolase domain-containing protein n=1 Tax=Paraphaeosphaeria minitans TaxID=565426 RepID=A0A9P6GX46_9PLEO|nr:hypothetical protein PMIN01_01353 [Paraphaeosphaeria minitans]